MPNNMHRVLLRVVRRGSDSIVVVVPSYSDAEFHIQIKDIGFTFTGEYLLAMVNIGATKDEDVRFETFEQI